MKIKYLLLLFLPFVLFGCIRQEDDFISKYCPGSCTVIQGRLTTDDGSKALAGVKLNVHWRKYGTLNIGGTERRKAVATTDANGNYTLRFLLRDGELPAENYDAGYVTVEPELSLEDYYFCYADKDIYQESNLTRDTTITLDYTIPRKAFLNLSPVNLQAMQPGDRLEIQASTRSGVNNAQSCATGFIFSSTSTAPVTAPVAANQPITLRIIKTKNGATTITEEVLDLTPGERLTYELTF